jgi:NAD(P)-dependent dehydrogenase (short-subunit alcohol dehydrogenase family)
MELAEHGIRVNGFTPTATQPANPELVTAPAGVQARYLMDFTGQFPMRRLPGAQDYVGAVVFLASDDSVMITGSNITVDGGATAKYWPWVPHAAMP